jgi:hypothetical protein
MSTQAQGKGQIDSVKSRKPTHFNKQRHNFGKRNLQTQHVLHRKPQGQFDQNNCRRCGHKNHRNGYCPALKSKCYVCGITGHLGKICFRKNKQVHEVAHTSDNDGYSSSEISNDMNNLYLGTVEMKCETVKSATEKNIRPWIIHLKVHGSIIKFKVDTGADATVMSSTVHEKLKFKPKLKEPNVSLKALSDKLQCTGYFGATSIYKAKLYHYCFYVVKGIEDICLLGRNECFQMKIVCPDPI